MQAITASLGEKGHRRHLLSVDLPWVSLFTSIPFFLLIPLAKALYRRTRRHYMFLRPCRRCGRRRWPTRLCHQRPDHFLLRKNLGSISDSRSSAVWRSDVCVPSPDMFTPSGWTETSESPANRTRGGFATRRNSGFFSSTSLACPVSGHAPSDPVGFGGCARLLQWQPSVQWLDDLVQLLGDKNVALSMAAAVALVMLYRSKKDANAAHQSIQSALSNAGVVILITAAGGAFGQMIRQTDIASQLAQWVPSSGSAYALLVIAFFATALVRVAQGSATVAMITSIGIIGPLAATMGCLQFRLLVMAIGAVRNRCHG